MSKPFRWNVARREQLGRLIDGVPSPGYEEIVEDLRACAAPVLAVSGDSDLVFVGRSADSLFDYLSGALASTTWRSRLTLVNLSLREQNLKELHRAYRDRFTPLYNHLSELDLAPAVLVRRRRPIAFVDLVDSGATFAHLVEVLLSWARESRADAKAVVRKIRFIGLTWRTKTSPKTVRWHQCAAWLADFPGDAVKNVSIPGRLWDYLGNRQPKAALSNPPWRWGEPAALRPPRHATNLEALRFALRMYDLGGNQLERTKLITLLTSSPAIREYWMRSLVSGLRRGAARSGAPG
jgi:hypothetical protein